MEIHTHDNENMEYLHMQGFLTHAISWNPHHNPESEVVVSPYFAEEENRPREVTSAHPSNLTIPRIFS